MVTLHKKFEPLSGHISGTHLLTVMREDVAFMTKKYRKRISKMAIQNLFSICEELIFSIRSREVPILGVRIQ